MGNWTILQTAWFESCHSCDVFSCVLAMNINDVKVKQGCEICKGQARLLRSVFMWRPKPSLLAPFLRKRKCISDVFDRVTYIILCSVLFWKRTSVSWWSVWMTLLWTPTSTSTSSGRTSARPRPNNNTCSRGLVFSLVDFHPPRHRIRWGSFLMCFLVWLGAVMNAHEAAVLKI